MESENHDFNACKRNINFYWAFWFKMIVDVCINQYMYCFGKPC